MSLNSTYFQRVNLSSTGTAGDWCKIEAQDTTHNVLIQAKSGSDILLDNPLYYKNSSNVSTALNSTLDTYATDIAGKQDTIGDNDLAISHVSGLQTALDGKQATIADGDLTIARTDGLQAALDSKQASLTFDSAPTDSSSNVVESGGVFTALAGKQDTIADGDLTIARTDGLQSALDGKQATIADGDLTIARTDGLQAALDAKASSTDVSTLQTQMAEVLALLNLTGNPTPGA